MAEGSRHDPLDPHVIEPMMLETQARFSKRTKKRLQNSIFIGLIFITLITTIIGGVGLMNGVEKQCEMFQLQTVNAKICENNVLLPCS